MKKFLLILVIALSHLSSCTVGNTDHDIGLQENIQRCENLGNQVGLKVNPNVFESLCYLHFKEKGWWMAIQFEELMGATRMLEIQNTIRNHPHNLACHVKCKGKTARCYAECERD